MLNKEQMESLNRLIYAFECTEKTGLMKIIRRLVDDEIEFIKMLEDLENLRKGIDISWMDT